MTLEQAHPALSDPSDSVPPARSSTFYYAMRILPRERREAMYAIYAFCRAVDDIADADGPTRERRAGIAAWRRDIDGLYRGQASPKVAFLEEPVHRFGLARDDFHAVLDGMESDIVDTWTTPDWHGLDLYCDRVASAVGRLSVRIFGIEAETGVRLAYHLGRALQLTNILRDVDEDAEIGRIYLPRESLEQAGIRPQVEDVLSHPALDGVCRKMAEVAMQHFATSRGIMRALPLRQVRAPKLMCEAYSVLLSRLLRRGWQPPRSLVRISKPEVAFILVRHGLFQ